MTRSFFDRLADYYRDVAAAFRGQSGAAGAFSHRADIGDVRESLYRDFLRQHVPSSCNIFKGGQLVGNGGTESAQIDIIVTSASALNFNLTNRDNSGKAFAMVEGTIAVASLKSNLNQEELAEALSNIASIPPTAEPTGRVAPSLRVATPRFYEDWPFKIVFAPKGIAPEILKVALSKFYAQNSHIPLSRRPNIIHVAGSVALVRAVEGLHFVDQGNPDGPVAAVGEYVSFDEEADIQALLFVTRQIHHRVTISSNIIFDYDWLMTGVTSAIFP